MAYSFPKQDTNKARTPPPSTPPHPHDYFLGLGASVSTSGFGLAFDSESPEPWRRVVRVLKGSLNIGALITNYLYYLWDSLL